MKDTEDFLNVENIKNQAKDIRQQKCNSRIEVLQQSQWSGQESPWNFTQDRYFKCGVQQNKRKVIGI